MVSPDNIKDIPLNYKLKPALSLFGYILLNEQFMSLDETAPTMQAENSYYSISQNPFLIGHEQVQ